ETTAPAAKEKCAETGNGHIYKMSPTAVVGAHDMQFAIVPFVTPIGVEFQVGVSVCRKAELFQISIPVRDAVEKLFDVVARRMQGYIDSVVSGSVLGCDQLAARAGAAPERRTINPKILARNARQFFFITPLPP